MGIFLLGENCLMAGILKDCGIRTDTSPNLPFDYLCSNANAICFYLNTRFTTYIEDFTTDDNGYFINKRVPITLVHENELKSNIRSLEDLKRRFKIKVDNWNNALKQGDSAYFIRYERYNSTGNFLQLNQSVKNYMSGRGINYKFIYVAFDKTVQNIYYQNIQGGTRVILPYPDDVDLGAHWKESEGWQRLSKQLGEIVRSLTEPPKVIHTKEQKIIIQNCRCAFFPVELSGSPPGNIHNVDLSLGAIIRNCGRRVREWLAFHRAVGVRRFCLVLDRCNDNTKAEIESLPFRNDIYIHEITNGETMGQMGAYKKILDYYGKFTTWMAFLDDDEFLYPVKCETLTEALEEYTAYSGVFVHWKWFGSNGHVVEPDGLVIENYTRRAPADYVYCRGIKSIVKPSEITDLVSSHRFYTRGKCVTEEFHKLPLHEFWRSDMPPVYNVFAINHYKTRSMADWVKRNIRGNCNEQNPPPYDSHRFKHEDRNEIEDVDILRFADRTRKEML